MIAEIFRFIRLEKPNIIIQSPARINLINPLDAVEADFWMPSVAINGLKNPLSVFLFIKTCQGVSKLKLYSITQEYKGYNIRMEKEEPISKNILDFREKFSGEFKLFYATIFRFYKTCAKFGDKFKEANFEIGILNTIPRQSGLGGSASMIIAILYGLSKYLNLYNNLTDLDRDDFPINKDIIAEMATKVEDEDLKITAGYGDRYVISKGGLLFCSYYGKLYHKDLSMEPLAVCERIDKRYKIKNIPAIICFSGIYHDSGDVHGKLRKLYLLEDSQLLNGYKRLAEISWKSRFLLMKQDWKQLGNLFRENTEIINEIMEYAGFEHGIGLGNKILISLIEDHPDVYAVKLTGAGGGGSVFALVRPNKIDTIEMYWKNRLDEVLKNEKFFLRSFPNYPIDIKETLKNAQFFQIKIAAGVKELVIR